MLEDGECDGNADARAAFEKPIFMLKATSMARRNLAPVPDKPVTWINGYLASKHEAKQVGNNYFTRYLGGVGGGGCSLGRFHCPGVHYKQTARAAVVGERARLALSASQRA